MKKLPPNGAIIMSIVAGGLGPVVFILIGCAKEMPCIIFSIISLIWGVYMVIDDYYSNCIQYGNGRIIIKRRNKKIINGRPVGKWETKEDEFLLEEIEIYALASQSFGFHRYVEFHPSNMGVFSRECVFQLKDGRRISYESTYYTRKEEMELIRYVHDEAGIEFQGPPMSKW